MLIYKIALKILRKLPQNRFTKTKDYNNQKAILDKLGKPKDLLERSYFQYLCQMKQTLLLLKIFQSLASIVLIPWYYFKHSNIDSKSVEKVRRNRAILFAAFDGLDYIPKSILDEYDEIEYHKYGKDMIIGKVEKELIRIIILRYWSHPYFCLKCMLKIALYAYQINTYKPSAIITSCEYSFTSSILTHYCNQKKVEHINIMHGDKIFNITDAFVCFNRFFVWDNHYKNLFIELRACEEQFVTEEVESIMKKNHSMKRKQKYIVTYYLQGESRNELKAISSYLHKTNIPSETICLRPHPRYSNEKQCQKYFRDFSLESPHEISIEQSLASTRYVISKYSTVLLQAEAYGNIVVIDDITNKESFERLRDLKYIMFEKQHILFSELLNGSVDYSNRRNYE